MEKIEIGLRAICIATVHAETLPVLFASIEAYVPPDVELYVAYKQDAPVIHAGSRKVRLYKTDASNYGDAYNFIVKKAFEDHNLVIVANDDVVFTPTTYYYLLQDIEIITKQIGFQNIGWLGARTDYAIGMQNIRHLPLAHSDIEFPQNAIKHQKESLIKEVDFIAPICGIVSQQNWVDYLPINYFSDNIQCREMSINGNRHFISRAYVHHVGSQSLDDAEQEMEKAIKYLERKNKEKYSYVMSLMRKN